MSNLSDKEIDRLSREAADLYEPDDSSLSWSRLEQRLSIQMPERPPDGFRFGRINPYVWGSAVVLVASVSFFMIKNILYSQHSTRTNETIVQTINSPSNIDKRVDANTVHIDSASSVVASRSNESENASLSDESGSATNTSGNKSSAKDKITTEAHYAECAAALHNRNKDFGSAKNLRYNSGSVGSHKKSFSKAKKSKILVPAVMPESGIIAASKSFTDANNRSQKTAGSESDIKKSDADEDLMRSTYNSVNNKHTSSGNLLRPVVANAGVGTITGNDSLMNAIAKSMKPAPRSVHINRSLNFGLVFGPDYTDAGGIANNQLGNNIGLTVGYYLTNKLSVNTGIVYSNKFYWSPRKFPSPQLLNVGGPQQIYSNTTYAAAPVPVEYLNGASNMWEIPLTLRYDFAKNKKSKFFVNAGLSSYFMMNQTSIYYSHNGFTPLAWKKTDNQQVNYWFDVANISLGIETHVGGGFSFQFEPYLKLPLKKMGMENLTLNSYGMLISIRYAPVLSRSKK